MRLRAILRIIRLFDVIQQIALLKVANLLHIAYFQRIQSREDLISQVGHQLRADADATECQVSDGALLGHIIETA